MNRFSKFIAVILTLVLVAGVMPLSFAQNKEQIVSESVNEDYNNFLSSDNDLLSDDYVPGEILFNYVSDNNSKSSSVKSIEKEFNIKIEETIDQSALNSLTKGASLNESQTLYRASFDSDSVGVYELCKAMNELDNIRDCEPNYTYKPSSTFVMPTEISDSSEYTNRQKWYFDKMNIPQTWQNYSTLGEGEVVCVIDCGLNYTHNEIKNNLWTDAEGNHGYNAEFNNNDIYGQDPKGPAHGSHCAGIIAMEGSNGGLVGVAPKAKIMVCNAVTASTGTFSNANLIKSIEYAIDNGADIISMSLGGYAFSFNLDKALTRASFGAVICCAAGNDAKNASNILHWPSASAAVIGVMALGSGTSASTLSSYSNYDLTGRYYQVAAPGTDIYAINANTDNGYTRMSGTSMATPFMAGICALYASVHPNMSAPQMRNALIKGDGEMIKGYKSYSDAQTNSFKRVTSETLLGFTGDAPINVSINDDLLNTKVREALNVNNSYQLTNYDLECVSSLDLSSTDFRAYSELSKLGGLTYINLSNTNMSNTDALQAVNNLPATTLVIDFSHNNLTNLDFMRDYNSYLSRANFSFNKLTNIAGISGFTSLSELNIAANKIKDISPVSTLSGLVYLYAPGNQISDPKPVVNLKNLEEAYFGNFNPNLSDFFGELFFTSGNMGNNIRSLAPFTKLSVYSSSLHYLNLSYNELNYDSQYNSNAAKLMQLLDQIGKNNSANESNPFTEQTSKLVLLPNTQNSSVNPDSAIVFENETNFATLGLEQRTYQIPCSSNSPLTYKVNDESVASVSSSGELFLKKAGYAYVTIKSDSEVKTFFFTVKDSVVKSAGIYNPSSLYAAGEEYKAIVYTSTTDKIKLVCDGSDILGEYSRDNNADSFTDSNGNKYLRWIVPFEISQNGDHQIKAYAYSQQTSAYTDSCGSFNITLTDKTDNTLSGVISGYNTAFNAKVTLCDSNGEKLQQAFVSGLSKDKTFKFTNVPNGSYIVKAEKDGCKDAYIFNVVVNGDTFIDDNIDLCSAAGDTNADNAIDISDISEVLLSDNYGNDISAAANILCDADGDLTVSLSDISIIVANYAK